MQNTRRFALFLAALLLFGFTALLMIGTTATPAAAQPVFVTNTPRPQDPLNVLPDASIDQYALRLWTEGDLIDLFESQLERLAGGQMPQQNAIRLTQYEMSKRFPNAPTSTADRDRLLNLMLQAPRGTVDMRDYARPYLVDSINSRLDEIDPAAENTVIIDGFLVQTVPMNLDNDGVVDALFAVRYPSEAVTLEETIYKDFFLVGGEESGVYALLGGEMPAAPLNDVQDLTLNRLGDLNLDGLDEVALTINRDSINDEIVIYGARGDTATRLTRPGRDMLAGEIIQWNEGDPMLILAEYEVESERWQCISQVEVEWMWEANFYRPVVSDGSSNQASIGCALAEAEPIFARPPDETITTILDILKDGTLDQTGSLRGSMALAMLYWLNGQPERAQEQIANLQDQTASDEWLAGQVAAFSEAAQQEGVTAVEICAALVADAGETGMCDLDQVIGRILANNPIPREGDLATALEAAGLPVASVATVSQIGFADRESVVFDLPVASAWLFAPTDPEFYVPEPADIPEATIDVITPATIVEGGFISPPRPIYTVIIEEDNSVIALNAVENAQIANPEALLSPEAQYIRALIYDLRADRTAAKDAYYALWVEHAGDVWGQLAGAHLERRGEANG